MANFSATDEQWREQRRRNRARARSERGEIIQCVNAFPKNEAYWDAGRADDNGGLPYPVECELVMGHRGPCTGESNHGAYYEWGIRTDFALRLTHLDPCKHPENYHAAMDRHRRRVGTTPQG